MFGVDSTELLIIALAALIFIGPKELPTAMRTVGRWVGRARAHARHFTSGIENMMREAELEEMEKRWREENERIMREHPVAAPYVGASEEASTNSSSLALGEVEEQSPAEHQRASIKPVLSDAAGGIEGLSTNENGREPPSASLTSEEPGLPLPEPEHHKRDLP